MRVKLEYLSIIVGLMEVMWLLKGIIPDHIDNTLSVMIERLAPGTG